MRRPWLAIAFAFVALHGTPSATSSSAAQGPTGAISGVVINAITREPVSQALVSVARMGGDALLAVLTDSRGRFVFRDVPANESYTVRATHDGYFDGWYGADTPVLGPRQIQLSEGQWVNNARIGLWPPGSISGTVLDERGEPVVGVYVRLLAPLAGMGSGSLVAGYVATTDDRGMYRITGVTRGAYVVMVPSGQSTDLADAPVRGDAQAVTMTAGQITRLQSSYVTVPPMKDGLQQVYPTIYYPVTRDLAQAGRVVLEWGQSVEGIDLRLSPVAARSISGRVEGPREPGSFLLLRAVPVGADGRGLDGEQATTALAADGTFVFMGLPAGRYTIDAAPQIGNIETSRGVRSGLPTVRPARPDGFFMPSGLSTGGLGNESVSMGTLGVRGGAGNVVSGRLPVDVEDHDAANLVLALSRGSVISGHVVVEDAPADQSGVFGFILHLQPSIENSELGLRSATQRSPIRPDNSDTFSFEGLRPGEYFLGSGFSTIKSVRWHGLDLTSAPLDTSNGQDFTDVEVTMTTRVATIEGMVRASNGGEPASSVVLYFPADRRVWSRHLISPIGIGSIFPDSTGRYSIARLAAGSYYVVALPAAAHDQLRDPAFLEAASRVASPVTVGWGDTKTVNLPVHGLPGQ